MFSILDLTQGFHQQPLDPESRHITGTNTPLGVFQWRVNVMGLMNASSQIQRMMDDRLSSVADTTTPFIDDILIGTTATEEEEDIFEKHDRDLRKTLDIMENDQFVTNPKKCHFYVSEEEFCEFVLDRGSDTLHQGS